jgi:hypothetical protein
MSEFRPESLKINRPIGIECADAQFRLVGEILPIGIMFYRFAKRIKTIKTFATKITPEYIPENPKFFRTIGTVAVVLFGGFWFSQFKTSWNSKQFVSDGLSLTETDQLFAYKSLESLIISGEHITELFDNPKTLSVILDGLTHPNEDVQLICLRSLQYLAEYGKIIILTN